MDGKLRQIMSLSSKLQSLNNKILLNPAYIEKTQKLDSNQGFEPMAMSDREDRDLQMVMAQSLNQH